MKRVIKAEEKKVWQDAMRGVRRTKPSNIQPAEAPSVNAAAKSVKPRSAAAPTPGPKSAPRELAYALDGETAQRLKTKTFRPQARLDLHGMTETSAHRALVNFVKRAVAKNQHLVLVITGKGAFGNGVLRQNLPLWLEAAPLHGFAQAIAPAFADDGGDGAFYIHLRRTK